MKAFLCHSSTDKSVVKEIAEYLENNNIEIWLDEWEMTPGDSLADKISQGLESSDRIIVFISPESIKSNWVKQELSVALGMEINGLKGEKFIIPVLLNNLTLMPIMLIDKFYVDFNKMPFDIACELLLSGITNDPVIKGEKYHNENLIVYQYGNNVIIEFQAKISPIYGFFVRVNVESGFTRCDYGFNRVNTPHLFHGGGMTMGTCISRESPILEVRMDSPPITNIESFYVKFENAKTDNIGVGFFDSNLNSFFEEGLFPTYAIELK